ncbi:hypothetical protein D3C76_1117060 [compost metagenome]
MPGLIIRPAHQPICVIGERLWLTRIPHSTVMSCCWPACCWRRSSCCVHNMRMARSLRAGRTIILPRIQPLSSSAMLSYTNCWRRRIGRHCNRCMIICSCFLSELFPSCLQGAVTRRIIVGYCVQHWDFCMNCSDWRRLSNGRNSGWRKGWILHLMENGRSAATVFIVRSATSC